MTRHEAHGVRSNEDAAYLLPYLDAARQFGDGFGTLLWASPKTQRMRFDAIRRAVDLTDRSILDAGCGRGDLIAYLRERHIRVADYIGLEAVEPLAAAAEARVGAHGRILRADFVRDPVRLFVGADVIVFSGSLNTMAADAFYQTLQRAYDAATHAVVFNYLCSPALAGKDYLTWHRPEPVRSFAARVAYEARVLCDYLIGDETIAMLKPPLD